MDKFEQFKSLHKKGDALVLLNCWDAASARFIELSGAMAIATTSSGVSFSMGRPDGQGLRRDEMVDMVHRIVRSVSLPVTADMERGYGTGSPEDCAESARQILEAGAIGLNLEDSPGDNGEILVAAEFHAERIRAIKQSAHSLGRDIFVNARTDVFLRQYGELDTWLSETIRRAGIFQDAGADSIFVPGVVEIETISKLASEIDLPLNVMATPRTPNIYELNEAGVSRISVGPFLQLKLMQMLQSFSQELFESGDFAKLDGALSFAEVNAMFPR